jgi:hypothetical protein
VTQRSPNRFGNDEIAINASSLENGVDCPDSQDNFEGSL